jgi:hypothetical protein
MPGTPFNTRRVALRTSSCLGSSPTRRSHFLSPAVGAFDPSRVPDRVSYSCRHHHPSDTQQQTANACNVQSEDDESYPADDETEDDGNLRPEWGVIEWSRAGVASLVHSHGSGGFMAASYPRSD